MLNNYMNSFYTVLLTIFHVHVSPDIWKSYISHHLVVWKEAQGMAPLTPFLDLIICSISHFLLEWKFEGLNSSAFAKSIKYPSLAEWDCVVKL